MTAASSSDPFDLARFVAAQATTFEAACAELRAGHKRSHWMWFVFPQIEGLGSSERAQRYAIRSAQEARAYLAHPVLGPRLETVTRLVLGVDHRTLEDVFGTPDHLKFRSSMTLFEHVAEPGSVFSKALTRLCGDEPCQATLDIVFRAEL